MGGPDRLDSQTFSPGWTYHILEGLALGGKVSRRCAVQVLFTYIGWFDWNALLGMVVEADTV